MGDRDDPDDVMETNLTIDYDKQCLNCVSAIAPWCVNTLNTPKKLIYRKLTKEIKNYEKKYYIKYKIYIEKRYILHVRTPLIHG